MPRRRHVPGNKSSAPVLLSTRHPYSKHLSLLTANARGFKEHNRDAWFRLARKKQHSRCVDVMFLPETHVQPAEVDALAAQHAAGWGRRPLPDE
ncbi:TPA: hypothetical protein N0F65_000904 [Lagenidium giganteum]|uniref:Uncharacterized protein n=1 Tax=Lagenidium giganteum TaxID=4803 RepID=A0AAV2Z2L0_9STRA|nr:TPA: hypothetical protein N0F65_000904 [Lagenidium giganteum]